MKFIISIIIYFHNLCGVKYLAESKKCAKILIINLFPSGLYKALMKSICLMNDYFPLSYCSNVKYEKSTRIFVKQLEKFQDFPKRFSRKMPFCARQMIFSFADLDTNEMLPPLDLHQIQRIIPTHRSTVFQPISRLVEFKSSGLIWFSPSIKFQFINFNLFDFLIENDFRNLTLWIKIPRLRITSSREFYYPLYYSLVHKTALCMKIYNEKWKMHKRYCVSLQFMTLYYIRQYKVCCRMCIGEMWKASSKRFAILKITFPPWIQNVGSLP